MRTKNVSCLLFVVMLWLIGCTALPTPAQPTADDSRPYRPEAYNGAVAGIGEYGVSFQYDPYLGFIKE